VHLTAEVSPDDIAVVERPELVVVDVEGTQEYVIQAIMFLVHDDQVTDLDQARLTIISCLGEIHLKIFIAIRALIIQYSTVNISDVFIISISSSLPQQVYTVLYSTSI